jgi:hypothetical protein
MYLLIQKQENHNNYFPGTFTEDSILMTRQFAEVKTGNKQRKDDSATGHGTKLASKIVGQFGIAKGATIVPVRSDYDDPDDVAIAFEKVAKDILKRRAKGGRDYMKSVSTTLFGV